MLTPKIKRKRGLRDAQIQRFVRTEMLSLIILLSVAWLATCFFAKRFVMPAFIFSMWIVSSANLNTLAATENAKNIL